MEAKEPRERREVPFRAASLGTWWQYWPNGGDPAMNTQITKRVVVFWMQMAPLVILSAIVIALATKYIW